jgi:conjugal transfer pilus assembly protein TraB
MKEKLAKIWGTLRPEQRKKSIIAGVLIVLTVVAFGIYKSTRGSAPPPPPSAKREINLGAGDKDVLEKSLYNESTKVIDDMKTQMEDLQKQLKAVQEAKEKPEAPSLPVPNPGSKSLPGLTAKDKGRLPVPEPPPMPSATGSAVPLPPGVPPSPTQQTGTHIIVPGAPVTPPKPDIYGGIKVVSQTEGDPKTDAKKKDAMKIYLPPSFMEGTLLSGMYAPANEGGKGEPLPGLVRIKNLAVLPNSVKADLKGCFVIVEAHGSLFDERAHVRLDTLSCLARNGESVIDQKVKGYVVDQDGFVGLRGTVVSKMGAAVARSLFAGFVAGFGDAVAQSTTTTSISPLGTTQTFNTDEAAKAGAGKGLSQAGHDLQRFLLDLGKQAIPAIEVGAMRPVTVVISEGVDLEIKEKKNGCLNGDAACASPVF